MRKTIPSEFWKEVLRRWNETSSTPNAQRPVTDLARKINISISTCHSWIDRNNVNIHKLDDLKIALHWPELSVELISELGASISHKPLRQNLDNDRFDDFLVYHDRFYRKVRHRFEDYARQSLKLLETLGQNSIFIFLSSTTSPFEMEKDAFITDDGRNKGVLQAQEIARSVASAIQRGTLCLYIRPTEKGVESYQKWGFTELLTHEEAKSEIQEFRVRIRDSIKRTNPELSEAVISEYLGNIQQCYVDSSPMWMPGVGLSMFGHLNDGTLKVRMAISLPGKYFGGVLVYPEYDLLEQRLGHFVRRVVQDADSFLNKPDSVHAQTSEQGVHLDLPSSNDHTRAKAFYSKMSRILRHVSSIETQKTTEY